MIPELLDADGLRPFLGHRSVRVRRWAARGIRKLDPARAAEVLVDRSPDETDAETLVEAQKALADSPRTAPFAAALCLARKLAVLGLARESRAAAAALWPHAEPAGREELARLLFGRKDERDEAFSLARECPGPTFHARAVRLRGSEELFGRLLSLTPRDEGCAVHWVTALVAAGNESGVLRSWQRLEEHLIDIAAAAEERYPAKLDALLESVAAGARGLAAAPPDVPALRGERFAPFLAEARRVLDRQAALALALRDAVRAAQEAGSSLASEASLRLLLGRVRDRLKASSKDWARLRAARGVIAAATVAADSCWPDGWYENTLAGPLSRALHAAERRELGRILDGLLTADLRRCDSFAQTRRPVLFSLLLGDEAVPRLVEVLHASDLDWAPDAAAARLAAADPESLAAHLRRAEDNGLACLAEVLARPGESPGRVLACAAERLLTSEYPESFPGGLLATGSAAALSVLRDAYRPGERELAAALLTLADLHGTELPERTALEREESGAPGTGVEIFLRCGACRRSHHYEVSEFRVFMTPDGRDEVSFDHLIRCKRCGAIEDYQLSLSATRQARLGRDAVLGLHERIAYDDPAEVAAAARRTKLIDGYACSGRDFPSLREAHRHLLGAVRAGPGDASAWRRLGSLYLQGGLLDAAGKAYRKATRLDPADGAARQGLELIRRLSA